MRPFARAARHARWQSVLAVAAIAAAVTLPVVLVSVGGGVAAHELASLEASGYQIVVSAEGLHGIGGSHADAAAILAVPGVANATPILSVAVDAFNASGAVAPVLAEGVVPRQFVPTLGPTEASLFPIPLPLGPDTNDTVHYANGTYTGRTVYDVLVSSTYAAEAHVVVGDPIILSPTTNASFGVAYNVTGTFGTPLSLVQPAGAFGVVLLLSNLQSLTGYGAAPGATVADGADTIEVVVVPSDAGSPSALARIAAAIQARFPAYSVTTLSSEASQLRSAEGVLTGFYLALSSVGLAVGLLFLALVLVRRVEREHRSIGIRRAIGLSRSSVVAGFLAEGAALAGSGGATGVLAGYLVVEGLGTWGTSTVQEAARLAEFPPVFLAELVAGVVALAVLASAGAVRSLWRLDLAEALR